MKIILSLVMILIVGKQAYGQPRDSLTIYIWGEGIIGEKFKVYHSGKRLLKFRCGGQFDGRYRQRQFLHTVKIPYPLQWENGTSMNLTVLRKGRFGIRYRSTELNSWFQKGKKHYILDRNLRLKNRYAFNVYWSDRQPTFID